MRKRWNRISPTKWGIEEGKWRLEVTRPDPARGAAWSIYLEAELMLHGDKAVEYVSSAKRAAEQAFKKLLRTRVK